MSWTPASPQVQILIPQQLEENALYRRRDTGDIHTGAGWMRGGQRAADRTPTRIFVNTNISISLRNTGRQTNAAGYTTYRVTGGALY